MGKIDIKLNKKFFKQLSGSLNQSSLNGNIKLLNIFNLLNNNNKDNIIDIKEITDFSNSIFQADTNNDDEIDKKELSAYIKNNKNIFKILKIKTKDIIEFFATFSQQADKNDKNNQRINNMDGSYYIIYKDSKNANIEHKINYNSDNSIKSFENTETTISGKKIVEKDENGVLLSEEEYEGARRKSGIKYEYDGNKTIIRNKYGYGECQIQKEIEDLGDNKYRTTEYFYCDYGHKVITKTTDENGIVSKKFEYNDFYSIEIDKHHFISLSGIKKLIIDKTTNDSINKLKYCSSTIIESLAKEEEPEFRKTYIVGFINKMLEIGLDMPELSAIKKEIDEKGFENVSIESISSAYQNAYDILNKENPIVSRSIINNEYYQSKNTYTKMMTNSKIIIKNDQDGTKSIIDLNKLLQPFNNKDKKKLLEVFNQLPAEVLLDIAKEVTFSNEHILEGTDGNFDYITDKIGLKGGTFSIGTIVHELGHAIDLKGKGSENKFQTMNNAKFHQIFNKEMQAYLKDGNKRYCYSYSNGRFEGKNTESKDGEDNYATTDEQEMFAECYTILMLGKAESTSSSLIKRYFPETLAYVQKMVENTRKLSNKERHV